MKKIILIIDKDYRMYHSHYTDKIKQNRKKLIKYFILH